MAVEEEDLFEIWCREIDTFIMKPISALATFNHCLTGNEAMMLEGWTCCTCFVTVSPLAQMLFQVNKPEVVKKVADVLEVNGSEKDVTLRDLSTEIQELKGLVRISQMSSRPAGVVYR